MKLASTATNLTSQQAIAISKRKALRELDANTPTDKAQAEKMIYIDDRGTPRVIYKTGLLVAEPSKLSAPAFFIDANTGEILKQWDDVKR